MKTRGLVLLLAFGLLMAACSGSGDSDSGVASLETDDTTVTGAGVDDQSNDDVDPEQAMLALAACLRDQGLDIEDPTVDSDGNVQFGGFRGAATEGEIDREAMRAAMDSCQEELGGVVLGFGRSGFDPTELEDIMVEYAACMRDNGYDMDDPDLSGFGPGSGGEPGQGGGGPFGAIDRDDPDFVTANETCGDILAGLPGGGERPGRGNG
ncbi:MAG: hypothetical protein GY720_12970 [bacterium]|nr:hypothetical protein [bacterium]